MLETLLSVIIPVYNVEPYLEQCLDSVINQTYKNMEIICINDGSTDNSLKILEKYKLKDNRIKIVSQENKGLSEARNAGLKIAKGKYIAFVDSDDYIEPTMYEKLITPMLKDSSIDFSAAGTNDILEGRINRKVKLKEHFIKEEKRKVSLSDFRVAVWNKVYKKSIIQERKIDFPKGLYHEDNSFTPSYLFNSKYAYCIPELLYNHRIRDNSICISEFEEKYEVRKIDEWKVLLYLSDYLKKNGLFKRHKGYIKRCLRHRIKYFMVNGLQTLNAKWIFIKEFCKFYENNGFTLKEKISMSWLLLKSFSIGIYNKIKKRF